MATKSQPCVKCGATAYAMESVVIDSKIYHKKCFRCSVCKTSLKYVICRHAHTELTNVRDNLYMYVSHVIICLNIAV